MIQQGTWWVESKTDPRWNGGGDDYVGGLVMPPAAQAHVEKKKAELGCEPPDDLTYGYMKD